MSHQYCERQHNWWRQFATDPEREEHRPPLKTTITNTKKKNIRSGWGEVATDIDAEVAFSLQFFPTRQRKRLVTSLPVAAIHSNWVPSVFTESIETHGTATFSNLTPSEGLVVWHPQFRVSLGMK